MLSNLIRQVPHTKKLNFPDKRQNNMRSFSWDERFELRISNTVLSNCLEQTYLKNSVQIKQQKNNTIYTLNVYGGAKQFKVYM